MSLTGTTFCFSCYFWLQPVSQNVNTIKADNKAEQPNFLFAVAESQASVTISKGRFAKDTSSVLCLTLTRTQVKCRFPVFRGHLCLL